MVIWKNFGCYKIILATKLVLISMKNNEKVAELELLSELFSPSIETLDFSVEDGVVESNLILLSLSVEKLDLSVELVVVELVKDSIQVVYFATLV